MHAPIPILRSFSEEKAREFYLGFLGFTMDWEHRFVPTAPLYLQLTRGNLVLHLSEHYGDATPAHSSSAQASSAWRAIALRRSR